MRVAPLLFGVAISVVLASATFALAEETGTLSSSTSSSTTNTANIPPPTVILMVNGHDEIVLTSAPYVVSWASTYSRSCTMTGMMDGSNGTTAQAPNTQGSFQGTHVGEITFSCIGYNNTTVSKTVKIRQPETGTVNTTTVVPPPVGPPPPPPPPQPTAAEPVVALYVNSQLSIVSSGEEYTISYGSHDVQECKLLAYLNIGQKTTYPPANTTGSFREHAYGAYTFTCMTASGNPVTKTVSIKPATTAQTETTPITQPTTGNTTSVPDYYSTLRDLKPTAVQQPAVVSPIVPTNTEPPQSPPSPDVIGTIRKESEVQKSGETLEQVSRDVRRFEQTVTAQQNPPATLNPTIANPGVTDTPTVIRTVEELQKRDGLDLYTDSDHDGVSNFDELHIYNTDPKNAYTAGDALTDGERIVRGFDVHSTSDVRVPVESPLESGTESRTIFEVTKIQSAPVAASSSPVSSSTTTPETTEPLQKLLVFEGRALPNSFVTLYIYSTPVVVTVKTDENGNWKYTLDSELPDGDHNLYVAMVNNDGRIVAKSPPVPFTKQAEAVEFVPLNAPPITEPTLIDTLRDNMMVVGALILFIFATIVIGFLGLRKTEPVTPAL